MAGAHECGTEHSGCIKCGEFLDSRGPVNFSERTLPHVVRQLVS
jgi:hypothetical protein